MRESTASVVADAAEIETVADAVRESAESVVADAAEIETVADGATNARPYKIRLGALANG